MALKYTFDNTNLDLENASPNGGPINAPDNLHQQHYTPQIKYLDQTPIRSWGQIVSSNTDLTQFKYTNYDVFNAAPNSGAPINVPDNDHTQRYIPRDTYKDHGYQEARSVKSGFGIEGDEIQPKNIFKEMMVNGKPKGTNLDLESPFPLGGPINVDVQRHSSGFVQPNTPTEPYVKPGDLKADISELI